jgi:MFS transporter, DHA3 family, macrolide efflux protein
VRLALDARFVAFWLAQTISLFGDRLHQVALAVLVYALTNSPLATGLVFVAATLPNILLGPIAGTFVDRWDHKRVLIVSDLLRAGLVLAIPVAATAGVALIYPLVFLITAVSLFFRPAKVALVPRIVARDDLLAANSATWTADTVADIAGFPLAGLLVAFLGPDLTLAFAVDSATYLLSALLLAFVFVPPMVREAAPRAGGAVRTFVDELVTGWRFLRRQPPLIQNTLISALAQATAGVTLALTVVYARDWLDGTLIPYPESYAAIETAIGVGNLLGGVAVGAIGSRLRKGWLVVGGFVVMGLATVFLGLTGNVALALIAALVIGIANLVYIIPTQTLFIELTPLELMGRVVAFRSSLVFGSMMAAMAVSGLLAEMFPVGLVIAGFGLLTTVAGMIGALLPAVRDA